MSDIVISSNAMWWALIIGLWSLPWTGIALWRAAQKKDLFWFVVLMIFNTAGILDIIYIYLINRDIDKK